MCLDINSVMRLYVIMCKEGCIMERKFDKIINGIKSDEVINLFGITHYFYDDCPKSELVKVNGFNVRKDCAMAFKTMSKAAKKDGANLKVVSGYRSSHYQIQVFRSKFKGNYPTDEQMKVRLKYSAPSGYSEHHTGLAVDINDTEERFKDTKEYAWLIEHAQEYGFEMSFPEDNAQGLGFEPWHWRYVGINCENKKVFENARRNDPRFITEYHK